MIVPALLAVNAFGYDPTLAPYAFDPGKARALLREAGYPDGLAVALIASPHLEVQATVVGKMLEQAGFTVARQMLEPAVYNRKTRLPDLDQPAEHQRSDIALTSWNDSVNFPPLRPYHEFALGGFQDWVMEEPELQRLSQEVLRTVDREQQQALIRQMEQHTRDQAYFLFLYNPIKLYGGEQSRGLRAICEHNAQPRRDRGDGGALVGTPAEDQHAGVTSGLAMTGSHNAMRNTSFFSWSRWLSILLIVLGGMIMGLAGMVSIQAQTAPPAPQADPDNAEQVALGQQVYASFCAGCHGAKLEGQPGWQKRLPMGNFPAPPHDESGHTWHHADPWLFDIVKYGGRHHAPPRYRSAMPAYQDMLSDAEIWAALAFIKSRWPAAIRVQQAQHNVQGR